MTTVVSKGAEARAGTLGVRAERARDWLAGQLTAPFSFDLFVLDEDVWAEHAEVPVYGIPHANSNSGKIVLGSRPATLFDSVCAQLPVYMTFCRAGCDVPPSQVAYSALVDMASSIEDGGFANYVWYQCRLIIAAERLWDIQGVEALRALQAGEGEFAAEVERNWP